MTDDSRFIMKKRPPDEETNINSLAYISIYTDLVAHFSLMITNNNDVLVEWVFFYVNENITKHKMREAKRMLLKANY